MPEVGLERDSKPCKQWEVAEHAESEASPGAERGSPRWKVWTLFTLPLPHVVVTRDSVFDPSYEPRECAASCSLQSATSPETENTALELVELQAHVIVPETSGASNMPAHQRRRTYSSFFLRTGRMDSAETSNHLTLAVRGTETSHQTAGSWLDIGIRVPSLTNSAGLILSSGDHHPDAGQCSPVRARRIARFFIWFYSLMSVLTQTS